MTICNMIYSIKNILKTKRRNNGSQQIACDYENIRFATKIFQHTINGFS